ACRERAQRDGQVEGLGVDRLGRQVSVALRAAPRLPIVLGSLGLLYVGTLRADLHLDLFL
ncbi:MAG: hypothetical protein KA258_01300, partial [Deltaproteobacteria bacterium]|nr:hypothetical protein [Deltaproteobacteria bacterium]